MATEEKKFKKGLAGIVMTAWQRFDHFAVLCELWPAGIPSLAVTLLATSHGFFDESLKTELYSRLDCDNRTSLYETFIDVVKRFISFYLTY
jgi:hexosaminidase